MLLLFENQVQAHRKKNPNGNTSKNSNGISILNTIKQAAKMIIQWIYHD